MSLYVFNLYYTLLFIIAICRDLNHPNIITLFAYCITREEVVLVMNYVNGSNLDKLLFSRLHDYKEAR